MEYKVMSSMRAINLVSNFCADFDENTSLSVRFQGEEFKLRVTADAFSKRKLEGAELIKNGMCISNSIYPFPYYINGKTVYLLSRRYTGPDTIEELNQSIQETIRNNEEAMALGLQDHHLHQDSLEIYDEEEGRYLDYPCMYTDSYFNYPGHNMQIFEKKTERRYGVSLKAFANLEDILVPQHYMHAFEPLLEDLATMILNNKIFDESTFNLIYKKDVNGNNGVIVRLDIKPLEGVESYISECDSAYIMRKIKYIVNMVIASESIARANNMSEYFNVNIANRVEQLGIPEELYTGLQRILENKTRLAVGAATNRYRLGM